MKAATNEVRQHILETAHTIISGKGFSAVGLNEILQASGVPKGSFYYYFGSKEAFGEALLKNYFANYISMLDALLARTDLTAAERLMAYFVNWLEEQSSLKPEGKCLVVKLTAEVSDLSDALRAILKQGAEQVIGRLADAIQDGITDGSLPGHLPAKEMATTLYQLWLGASVHAKLTRDRAPMESALVATRGLLGLMPMHQEH